MTTPHVFRWDLDKTYLCTEFDTIGDLLGSLTQSAEDKQNIPGTAALMREIRYGPDGTRNRIHIVSGSPRQMRRVLERKLRLDGADVDRLTLKPNLRNALRLRFRALRDQLGYKLPALLESRVQLADKATETCFGDDAEMDGLVYRLYADICGHRVRGTDLEAIISEARLYPDQADRIRIAAGRLPAYDPVRRILIHLDTGSPTIRFEALGPRVVPTFNTFQAALVLGADGRLDSEAIGRIAAEMIQDYGYTPRRLSHSMDDLIRRGVVPTDAMADVRAELGLSLSKTTAAASVADEEPVDYIAMLHDIHTWQKARKARRKGPGARLARLLGKND